LDHVRADKAEQIQDAALANRPQRADIMSGHHGLGWRIGRYPSGHSYVLVVYGEEISTIYFCPSFKRGKRRENARQDQDRPPSADATEHTLPSWSAGGPAGISRETNATEHAPPACKNGLFGLVRTPQGDLGERCLQDNLQGHNTENRVKWRHRNRVSCVVSGYRQECIRSNRVA